MAGGGDSVHVRVSLFSSLLKIAHKPWLCLFGRTAPVVLKRNLATKGDKGTKPVEADWWSVDPVTWKRVRQAAGVMGEPLIQAFCHPILYLYLGSHEEGGTRPSLAMYDSWKSCHNGESEVS